MKILLLFCLALSWVSSAAQTATTPAAPGATTAPKPQFLIILRLTPRLHDDKAWTEKDNAMVGAHFVRLKAAAEKGQVILAGRTSDPGDRVMGLVIFEAADEAEARAFMEGDPCVAGGIMTGELRGYRVAVARKAPKS